MNTAYRKKTIGTAVLGAIALAGIVVAAPAAQARFINFGSFYDIDGIVTGVTATTISVDTNGTGPITLQVNDGTRIARREDLGDFQVGDGVFARAQNQPSGTNVASFLRRDEDATTYGTAGERVFVQWGYVTAKTVDTLTVEVRTGNFVTFRITPDTKFRRVSNFSGVGAGDVVTVVGEDTGTEFFAKRIVRQQNN